MKKIITFLKPYPASIFILSIALSFMGFVSGFPTSIKLALFIFVIMIYLFKGCRISKSSICFLIYLFINILILQPNSAFHTWERYGLFCAMSLVTYCLVGKYESKFRWQVLKVLLCLVVVLSTLSFFAFFLGVNMMKANDMVLDGYLDHAGWFSGFYSHSIFLGILSSFASCFILYLFLKCHNMKLLLIAIPCVGSVMFAASRSAFLALIVSIIFMLYQFANNKKRFIKYIFIAIIALIVTFPLWDSSLDRMQAKQSEFTSQGKFGSRTDKWENRIFEFELSPIFGIGFSTVSPTSGDADMTTGVVEPGSSWLAIASMTGIIGFIFVLFFFVQAFFILRNSTDERSTLLMALLIFISINMISEGYVYAAGSPLCLLLWLIIGCCNDMKKN